MSAALPTFKDVWFQARKRRQTITALVLMADDSVRRVTIGPRGGWKFST